MYTALRLCWTAIALVALSVTTTRASDWVVSHRADGYTVYHGSPYYWRGDDAYTRALYTRPGYYQYGYYYPAQSYYQYSYSHTYYTPAPQATYKPYDWRSQLLKIAEERDKIEGKMRLAQQDHNQYLEAVQALGLQGNFRFTNYGASPYGSYGTAAYTQQVGSYGAQGQTQYGYSVKEVTELYGDNYVPGLFQQAAQLAKGSQQLAGQATTDFSSLVGQEGANKARVAEVLARGAAAAAALKASEPQASAKYTKQEFRIDSQAQTAPASVAPAGRRAQAAALLNARCAKCHTGAEAKGKFESVRYFDLTPRQRAGVIALCTTQDADKRMPRGEGNGPGEPLTDAELSLLIE